MSDRRVAIIGGGISGLAAALRLSELNPSLSVTLFEASGQLGGVLQTERRDGFLIERSADMFTTREPWGLDLCRRIGFADQLINTNSANRKAFVVRRGKLLPVPDGFTLMSPARVWPVLTSGILSPLGKLRMGAEYFLSARQSDADESLEAFVTRRFGREAFERLIQPLIGGIYTADPSRLSMAATMPQFMAMERKHGSLIRAMRRGAGTGRPPTDDLSEKPTAEESGARYGLFVAPRDGMASLVGAMAARLPTNSVRLNSPIQRIQKTDNGWQVVLASPNASDSPAEEFDSLVVATPANRANQLLRDVDPTLADLLTKIPYAGVAINLLAYRREQLPRAPRGFGFVVPRTENRRILAGSLSSVKFAGRAPDDMVLLRIFVGGACQPELLQLDDATIQQVVRAELSELLGAHGEPLFSDVARWAGAMPQYHVGHLTLVEQIEQRAATIPNFALAGNAYRGVGIPFCIHSGEQAAQQIASGEEQK